MNCCETCASQFKSLPVKPCKISNNRFFRNFPPPNINRNLNFENVTCPLDIPISIQPDPICKLTIMEICFLI